MLIRLLCALSAIFLFATQGSDALATPYEQPKGWPCEQVYNPTIPLGTIWQGAPIDAYKETWWENNALDSVLEQLEDLTLNEQDVENAIDSFIETNDDSDQEKNLLQLFTGLYERMTHLYQRQLEGILRFSQRQQQLAQKVSEAAAVLRNKRKEGATLADSAYKEAEADLEWITRVFDERQKLTLYICEEPIFLRQQLGFRARAIQKHLRQP
ncbi:MAG: hypothetical protein GDA50_01665 [Alphaproteobacteria bacterium GM202ARS2]|nr:hypothetical protein [Alphaproteobacteria bacterium GM202ARS2]